MFGYHRGLMVTLVTLRPLNEENTSVLLTPIAVEGQKSAAGGKKVSERTRRDALSD